MTAIISNNTQLCLTHLLSSSCLYCSSVICKKTNNPTPLKSQVSLLQPPRQPQLIYLARVHLSFFMRDIPRTSVQSTSILSCAVRVRDDETQPDTAGTPSVRQDRDRPPDTAQPPHDYHYINPQNRQLQRPHDALDALDTLIITHATHA